VIAADSANSRIVAPEVSGTEIAVSASSPLRKLSLRRIGVSLSVSGPRHPDFNVSFP
jgi:hypothetical protein